VECRNGGVGITNLADENGIRILPQDCPQGSRKSQAGLFIDLHLTDAIHFIFDGILDGDNVDRLLPDLIDEGIKRCRLSAACRTDRQQYTLRPADQSVQAFFSFRLKSKLREGHQRPATP